MATRKRTEKRVGSPSLNDLARALIDAARTRPDVIPPGWNTTEQLAMMTGISQSHIRRKIVAMMAAGKVESRKFLVESGGICRARPHYKLK